MTDIQARDDDAPVAPDDVPPITGEALVGILDSLKVVLANAPDAAWDDALDSAVGVLDVLSQQVLSGHGRRLLRVVTVEGHDPVEIPRQPLHTP